MKEKKQWHKPALIVLVRRKSEEAVLENCKYANESSPDLQCFRIICHDWLVS
jgi:hypothetical protein